MPNLPQSLYDEAARKTAAIREFQHRLRLFPIDRVPMESEAFLTFCYSEVDLRSKTPPFLRP